MHTAEMCDLSDRKPTNLQETLMKEMQEELKRKDEAFELLEQARQQINTLE